MDYYPNRAEKLKGVIRVPGDKSISHRAIILSSIASGKSHIRGFLESEDCLRTLKAFQEMGVKIHKVKPGEYTVEGQGLFALKEPEMVIYCGNSGTTMRLLTGLLSAQSFFSVLSGDESLTKRPMKRVIEPLTLMGGRIWSRENGYAPLGINGSSLNGIEYKLPVASAQVKSAILLAGLYANGSVVIEEPDLSRDHTERMLKFFGVRVLREENKITLPYQAERRLVPQEVTIPGDISSAAFFITAALLVPDSEVIIKNVGINPTRTGFLEVVKKMGGYIDVLDTYFYGEEPVANILVKSSRLKGITISGSLIPTLIDEIPIISLLASQAEGKTIIRDAKELRVKETDRIKAMVTGMCKLGVKAEELPDGMVIYGPSQIKGGIEVDSYGDHRVAMTLIIAGLLAEDKMKVNDIECINTSFPEFITLLKSLI